jgi:hypothetical protein
MEKGTHTIIHKNEKEMFKGLSKFVSYKSQELGEPLTATLMQANKPFSLAQITFKGTSPDVWIKVRLNGQKRYRKLISYFKISRKNVQKLSVSEINNM